MNTKHFAVLIMIAASLGAVSSQSAFGQSVQITEDLALSTDQVIFVIAIGAIAGAIKAWQGYDKSPNNFDLLKFINGIRDNILVSIPIAFGAALVLPELHAVGYVMIFFSVIGAASFAQKAKEKSIPSNASEEDIAKILEERE